MAYCNGHIPLFQPAANLAANLRLQWHTSAPLIRHVLSTVNAARYTNCYVCMYVCTVTVATAFGEEVSRM